MFERSQKPRPKVSQFEQWARATSEDPEAKAIKEENEQYRNLSKNELIEDMLDIILRHKKEIKKVPQAMYPAGAQKWASRRGLYATETFGGRTGGFDADAFVPDGYWNMVVE